MNKDQEIHIAQQIAEIRGIVTEGFRAVNIRLDKANGSIQEHEKMILITRERLAEMIGESKGVGLSWDIVIRVVGFVIALVGAVLAWKHF